MGVHALTAGVFLDRDGVLNQVFEQDDTTRPPRSLDELVILPEAPEALALLRGAGFTLVGVSNQPDVARGLTERSLVEALNARLCAALPLEAILTCLHDDRDACPCRKPRPGLLLEAAGRFGLELALSYMIGDRWSDVVAGQAAGCRSLLLENSWSGAERCRPDWRGTSLRAAAEWIVARTRGARALGSGARPGRVL